MVPGAYSTISTPEERRSRASRYGVIAAPSSVLDEQRVLVEAASTSRNQRYGLLLDAMNEALADQDAETDIAIQLKAVTVAGIMQQAVEAGDHFCKQNRACGRSAATSNRE